MKTNLIRTALVALGAAAFCGTASAEWTKTYVIEWYEPAMHYGATTGVIDPGTDCPRGSNAEPNWVQELVDAGYTREQAEWLRNPANPTRSPVHGQNQMAFRGAERANVYINPTSIAESGKFYPVTGTISEGIDLDGNASNGFTSPTGIHGVDNEFYHALGCWKTYRGPPRLSSGSLTMNDGMREGSWTVVVVVTGQGADPMNDSNVQVGFYNSPDKLVKDGNGAIATDYTFRIRPDQRFEAIFPASTRNGLITSREAVNEIWMRDPSYTRELQLLRARVSLQMQPDGSLKGYVGGYRPWLPVYRGWVNARGPVIEALTWVRLPDVYYALQRYADYSPSGPDGERTHISFAMRVEALPAFVMTPDASREVASVESYRAIAPPAPARPAATSFAVIDGLVPDRNATVQAGPNAVIVPPASAGAAAAATTATRGGGQ
jgi:hypothetical protein